MNFFWTFLFNVRCIWKNWLQYEKVFIKICWPYEKILWRFCQNFKEIEKKWNSSQQACSAGSEVGVLTNKLRKWHEWALWGVKCLNFWGLNQLYSMTSYLSALFFFAIFQFEISSLMNLMSLSNFNFTDSTGRKSEFKLKCHGTHNF